MIQKLTVKRDGLSWILYVCCLAYRIRWKGQLGWYLCDDQFQKSEYLYTVRIPRKLFEGLFSVLATKKNSQRFSISTVFRVTCFILYSAGNEIIPSYFTIQDAWRRFYLDLKKTIGFVLQIEFAWDFNQNIIKIPSFSFVHVSG